MDEMTKFGNNQQWTEWIQSTEKPQHTKTCVNNNGIILQRTDVKLHWFDSHYPSKSRSNRIKDVETDSSNSEMDVKFCIFVIYETLLLYFTNHFSNSNVKFNNCFLFCTCALKIKYAHCSYWSFFVLTYKYIIFDYDETSKMQQWWTINWIIEI